jgi:hypothetical protein
MSDDFCGSDIIDKMGWSDNTIQMLFFSFLSNKNLEDDWVAYLNQIAEEKMQEDDE